MVLFLYFSCRLGASAIGWFECDCHEEYMVIGSVVTRETNARKVSPKVTVPGVLRKPARAPIESLWFLMRSVYILNTSYSMTVRCSKTLQFQRIDFVAFISFISLSYGFKITRLASSQTWAVWSEEHPCVLFLMFPDDSEENSKCRCCTEFGRAKMQPFSQLTGWRKNCLASRCDHWQDHLYNCMALDVLQKWLQITF